ncbi:MAG TPA: amidohydrolase, partial [Saprospiraceae bacterium]|nr:amidohydrolase [Saprospiraceae bacterium]
SGIYMASSDELYITVKGKGGHGAMPQDTIDPIYIASSIIIGLQEIISRKSHPASPSILTIGKINSVGGATNIIPSEVKLEGTFRAMDEAWRKRAHLLIRKTCEGIAESFGGSAEVDIVHGYPVLINDEHLVQSAKQIASQILGTENVINLDIRMTSEDFAWYTQQIPGCFFRLGTGNSSKGITSGVHTATFDVDEDCLMIGANTLSLIALSLSSEC